MRPTQGNPAHLFRLQLLIIDGGLLVLRNILDQSLKSQGDTLVACLSREKTTITHLRSKGIITQFQNNILFPLGGRVPNTTDLDITLIVCLIRGLKCFGFNPKFNWKVGPPKGDVSLEADIWWLKNYRNKLCHIRETTEVQANDFSTWWNDIEQILIRLNPSTAAVNIKLTIEDFKTCPLDAEEEKRIKKEIEKWEDYEEKVDRLQEDVNVMKEDLDDLKKRRRDDDGKMEHMVDFFNDLQKRVKDLLEKLGEDRNITRKIEVLDTVLDVKGDAMDKPTIDWLENLILIACRLRKNTNSPEEDKELQTKLIEFVSRSESVTGANVIESDTKCVVIKFRCESNEQVLKLLQYLDSDDLKYQLEELANIVKQRIKTDKQIYFSWRFSSDCLERILEEIDGYRSSLSESGQIYKKRRTQGAKGSSRLDDRYKGEMVDIRKEDQKLMKEEITMRKGLGGLSIPEKKIDISKDKEMFQQLRKEFKDDLITFYNTNYSTVPLSLSPLFEEKDVPMESFYIRPTIINIKEGRYRYNISLSRMFKHYRSGREICLTADDEIEKTTFSKYLAFTWCQAHTSHDREQKYFEEADIECMHDFEFVFLALLRDSNDSRSIDDLIHELIVPHLAHSEKYTKMFLKQILNCGGCLVILDGLDEWVPFGEISPLLHHIYRPPECTVLNTMRSWQFHEKRHQMEFEDNFTLKKPTHDSRDRFAKRTIQRLKSISNEEHLNTEVNDLNRVIRAERIDELANVPLLLSFIISLWCDGAPIGSSKTEIYINIVELLLARTTAKYKELQSSPDPFHQDIPKCFAGHDHCMKYFALLVALGKLAYHALVEKNTLVFDELVARKYLKVDDMKLSLYSGILMEGKHTTSKVSFAHKTVQEFFVAIFICSKIDGEKTVLEKCKSIENILGMSTVLQFISGINATRMCEISQGFMYVINEDEETSKYRLSGEREWYININPLYQIQHMLVSCMKEIPESVYIKLYIQDLFIDKDTMQDLGRLSELYKNNSIKSLYLNTKAMSRSENEIIELISVTDIQYLQKLHLEECTESIRIERVLAPSLQSLALLFGTWTSYQKHLTEQLEQIRNLQKLYVSNHEFSHGILDMFVKFISSKKTLKEINLSWIDCIEHGRDCEQGRLDLSQHSQLKNVVLRWLPSLHLNISTPSLEYVTLWDTNIVGSSIILSPEMKSIKHVYMHRVEMSAESLQHLESLPQIVTVNINSCTIKPETERERLRKDIQSSPRFEVTIDDYNDGEWYFSFKAKKPVK